MYQPELWREFFLMIGGGVAALAGLVFVAISLNLHVVVGDPTHRGRAIGTLTGFVAAFVICAFALMGRQSTLVLGIEWIAVASFGLWIYLRGYFQALRAGRSKVGLNWSRVVPGTALYLAQILGALLFALGNLWGLYLASVSLIIFVAYTISGAWLLLLGIYQEETKPRKRK